MDANGTCQQRKNWRGDIPTSPFPALSYVLGVYFSDGCINNYKGNCYFILATRDLEFAESVRVAWNVLGRNPSIRVQAKFPEGRFGKEPMKRVVVGCKSLWRFVQDNDDATLIKLGLHYPGEFLRGLYEGDGCLFWKSGTNYLRLTVIYNTCLPLIEAVQDWLHRNEYHPCFYQKSKGRDKTMYEIRLNRQGSIQRLLGLMNPVIKKTPRSHANTEPRRAVRKWVRKV